MIVEGRAVGYSSSPALSVRRWSLWSIPGPARCFMLLVEAVAVALTVFLLWTQSVSHTDLIRVAVLVVLAIGYAESATRIDRLKRYLGSGKAFSNQTSVWTFAAVLILPTGWAALLAALLYAHALLQRRRDKSGHPYRVVFTAATVMLSVLAAGTLLDVVVPSSDVLHGGFRPAIAVILALVAANLVNFGLVLLGGWLLFRPPSVRAMLPTPGALGYELAAAVLGIVTAGFLLLMPPGTPVVLVLIAVLRRSSLVGELRRTARTDAKTGLLNAAAWNDHATGILSRNRRDAQPVTVLFCDLDRFKAVNDTYGHLVGDNVLVAVADCLRRELRGHDGLGRYGGEEFVIILDRLDLGAAHQVADRLRAAVSALHVVDGLQITVSIGLAHHQSEHGPVDLNQLLTRADAALYQAKSSGRDRVQTY